MEEIQLDFASDDTSAGFRLHRFEVLNWGTFDRKVWNIGPEGQSSLVTGDIGSGKTTIVDGIATLLVPPGKLAYNRTAASDNGNKERSQYSYIRGEHKKKRAEDTRKGEAVYLRDENTYAVLLAYFFNEGFQQQVTLAQVFTIRNHKVDTFYLISSDSLSVERDFANFGTEIKALKDRLNKTPSCKVYTQFSDYSSRFRQIFGGLSEEAFLLFRDTISTKQIVDLTSFVKSLMLEKSEKTVETIDDLCNNFDNLDHAYNAVAKAKGQIEMLRPIVSDGVRYREQEQELADTRMCRQAIPSYFARFEKILRETKIRKTEDDHAKALTKRESLKNNLEKLRQREGLLKKNIDAAGGGLLERIEEKIIDLEQLQDRKKASCERYQGHLKTIKLEPVANEAEFFNTRGFIEELLAETEQKRKENGVELFDKKTELKQASDRLIKVGTEIEQLKKRKSNVTGRSAEIRTTICQALNIDEDDLPFAGELIRVKEGEKEWQGSIERVFHNFGLSLLVSDNLYSKVSTYVDQTNLRGRIVYWRVRKDDTKKAFRDIEPASIVKKLDIKDDSEFYEYLSTRLNDMFGEYICCRSVEEFRKHKMAVTLQGQIKQGQKHEKDDRRAINDSKEYILGWNNREKITVLEKELDELFLTRSGLDKKIGLLEHIEDELQIQRDTIQKFESFTNYSDIDWQTVAREIEVQKDKQREIEESSNVIETLKKQLDDVKVDIHQDDELLEKTSHQIGGMETELKREKEDLAKCIMWIEPHHEPAWPILDVAAEKNLPTTKYTLDNYKRLTEELSRQFGTDTIRLQKQNDNLRDKIIRAMTIYCSNNEAETNDFGASIGSLDEFNRALTKLEDEDLPRHLENFRQMLREQTINGLALLSNELERGRNDIVERISRINVSLKEIEYNPGRYIELVPDKYIDREISDFNLMVKDCLSGVHGDVDDVYNEERFCKVRDIVLRLRQDHLWTKKVTDVRNWFTFAARENLREDDSEWEVYDDTSGKSGGQKEKLAYTILASALAYQFGLSWGEKKSRSFRFIAVDEAFGRMSEESTRYGLELFKKLNLQFVIITPLQKINIIENYVKSIHYVHNYEGKNSVVRKMSISEYQAEKDEFLKMKGNRNPGGPQ
jgi:uncharacterized protein YPO0396